MQKIKLTAPWTEKKCLNIQSTMAGVKWYIHEKDDDINEPSCPHCHTNEKPWKLNIYTGQIYDINLHSYNGKRISKAEMNRMWHQKGFRELVKRERKRYDELRKKDPGKYRALPPLRVRHGKVKIVISKKWLSYNMKRLR